jgi:TonB-dependent receptor
MTQMSPGLVLSATRQGGDLRATTGDPELKPFESTNFDLAFEWYYRSSSYVSVNYFRKKVSNFIVRTLSQTTINNVTDPSTGADPSAADPEDILAEFDLTTPTNGETATVKGFEFAIQHDFDTGWGIVANMTLVDSNAKLDTTDISQKFALTGLSDSQNLILYYEHGPGQVRLAWNHRQGFLQSLVQIQSPEPTFVRSYHQLDLSASYALNDRVSVFFEGINITQESVLKHGRYINQLLLAQQPGARYSVGLRGSF